MAGTEWEADFAAEAGSAHHTNFCSWRRKLSRFRALSRSGAQMLLQTTCAGAVARQSAPFLRLQHREGQTSVVAPRSELNAVTLGEMDKTFY